MDICERVVIYGPWLSSRNINIRSLERGICPIAAFPVAFKPFCLALFRTVDCYKQAAVQ